MEEWLLNTAKMELVNGVSQLFLKRSSRGDIILMIAKVTDDLLMAGSVEYMRWFKDIIGKRFPISKCIVDSTVQFNGCRISKSKHGDIEMSMDAYVTAIPFLFVDRDRRKEQGEKATQKEFKCFRSLAGALVWLGSGTLPQASCFGSLLHQQLLRLSVRHLCDANRIVKEIKDMRPTIRLNKPPQTIVKAQVLSFSDAAFNVTSSRDYGQTGIACGIEYSLSNGPAIYDMITWNSSKQKRVCHSSYGAEIFACTEADDRGFYIRTSMESIMERKLEHTLCVDSNGLYDTITTLHEGHDYRMRQTVQRIRDSFQSKELSRLRWIAGNVNVADARTKRNPLMHRLLSRITVDGVIELPPHDVKEVSSETWV